MDDKPSGCERHFSHLSIRRSSRSLLATTASKSTLSQQPWSECPINASAGTSASTDLRVHQPGSSGPHPISAAGQRFEKDSNMTPFSLLQIQSCATHAASIGARQVSRVALRWLVRRDFRVLGTLCPYLNQRPRSWESRRTVGLGQISRANSPTELRDHWESCARSCTKKSTGRGFALMPRLLSAGLRFWFHSFRNASDRSQITLDAMVCL